MQLKTSPSVLDRSPRDMKILKHFPTQKDFVVHMNHVALEKKYNRIKTVEDAFDSNYIKLSELKIVYTEEAPLMLIESWIMQLALFLVLPVEKEQVREIAWLIYDDNHFLNMAEMTLLFTRIKKGHYGQFFGRIDPAEILRWCRDYRRERGHYVSRIPETYESKTLKEAKEEFNKTKNQQL